MTQLSEVVSTTTSQGEPPRKHCWECLRRRLVCDSTRPVCKRCCDNSIVCPGYDEKQPLRWVKPGRVTARTRRQRQKVDNSSCVDSSTSKNDSENENLESKFGMLSIFGAMQAKALDKILQFDITSENFAALQASYHCKYNSRVKLPTSAAYSMLPMPLKCLFILTAMGYAFYRLPQNTEKQVLARAHSALAYWTGQVLQTLNEDIADEKTRASDGTMTSVIMLMFADQQLQPSCRWRFHFNGFMKMVKLRGGVEKLWRDTPNLRIGILSVTVMEAFANTTSPSGDQLSDFTHPKYMEFIKSVWKDRLIPIYIGSICPPQLFFDIIHVNHLRALATPSRAFTDDTPTTIDAQTILDRMLSFSPEALAEANGNVRTHDRWLLMGRIHQSAAVLYCILSLQYMYLLPQTKGLERALNTHYDRLLLGLKEALPNSNFKNCLLWPLVVAGTRAASGTAFERAFIADQLSDSVQYIGSSMPIFARRTLETFWESGKKGWDECWDQPYIFIT
ncbi:hypothetical protein F5Y19DRAFT_492734 [Xylariaceae sp. FL1651]|nr:hypothetical protein F5Y19DRAFT_492734 [Xylariaceae sp. FL1651]